MSFPALISAGFTAKEDSSQHATQTVDPTIKKEIEGGFVVTRRRFTRRVRLLTTGFTDMSHADKLKWDAFVDSVGVCSISFSYNIPVTGELVTVRFKEAPEAKYAGMGTNYRWDIKPIKLETV